MNLLSILAGFAHTSLIIAHDQAFFLKSERDRAAVISKKSTPTPPQALKTYLVTVSVDSFVADLRQVLPVLVSSAVPRDLPKNGFLTACAYALRDDIGQYDRPELLADLQQFVERTSPLRFSFVQTPLTISDEEKNLLRTSLLKTYPRLIPVFSVESSLGGGFRFFHEGEMIDRSWTGTATRLLDTLFAH